MAASVRTSGLWGSNGLHRWAAVSASAVALVAAGVAAPGASAGTQRVSENVSLRLVKKSGSSFTHRGRATGTVAGSVSSRMRLDSLSITGTVTVRARGGSLNLRIKGRARSGGLRSKFSGSATMAGGTGRYAHARGRGSFSGVVNRQTWAATIKASGSLTT